MNKYEMTYGINYILRDMTVIHQMTNTHTRLIYSIWKFEKTKQIENVVRHFSCDRYLIVIEEIVMHLYQTKMSLSYQLLIHEKKVLIPEKKESKTYGICISWYGSSIFKTITFCVFHPTPFLLWKINTC